MRIHLDKIASVTRNLHPSATVTVTEAIHSAAGAVIAGRVLGEKKTYNQLEDIHGRLTHLHHGDIVLGALGHRNALLGYEGVVPETLHAGDRIHMLNLGGVMGHCHSHNASVGAPFEVEVLGQMLVFPEFGQRHGKPAFIQMGALPGGGELPDCPVVYLAGTCMNAGKTLAACALIKHFVRAGLRVGGAKLTGVSLMRDTLAMKDYGACAVADFTDAGVTTTNGHTAVGAARAIFSALGRKRVDVIVAETGDGILGEYGVQSIFRDAVLKNMGAAFLLCANDPVGVLGGVREMREAFDIPVDVVLGPATDNGVGVRFANNTVGVNAINAINHPRELASHVLELLKNRRGVKAPSGALDLAISF